MTSFIRWLVNQTRIPLATSLRLAFTFFPLAVLILIGSYFYYQIELRHIHEQHEKTQQATVMGGVLSLDRSLDYATRDLLNLYERYSFQQLINSNDERYHARVANDWVAFSKIKGIYYKIRWIDENGLEKLRVNYATPEPQLVPTEKLQDRKERYFFADTFKLAKGEIYVSPLDLNIEEDVVEVPYVPTIRLGMPVFDRKGKKRGILMLNLFASDLLKRFGQSTSLLEHAVWLVNQDGFWLKGSSAEDEFGFMFAHPEYNMNVRHPAAWEDIRNTQSGQFVTKEGLWTYDTFYPLDTRHRSSTGSGAIFEPSAGQTDTESYQWKVISLLPIKQYNTGVPFSFYRHIAITLIGLAFAFALAYFIVQIQQARNRLLSNLEEMVESRTQDLQKVNEVLSQNEARLRSLFETIPDLIWLKDLNGVYLECNAAFEHYLGMKESEIKGRTDFELPHQTIAAQLRDTDADVIDSGRSRKIEVWYTFYQTGEQLLFEVVKEPVRKDDGTLVGVLGIARDITARKKAEEYLQLAAMVFRNSSEAIQITDEHNAIVGVNPAFEIMSGYTQEELLGKNPRILSSGRQDKSFYELMWASLNTAGSWQGELWNRRKNGEFYAAWITINVVYNEDGSVRNYIELCKDLTKEKAAEEQIWRQANFDFMTGLPNRSMFLDRLRQEIVKSYRTESKLALLKIRLDNFKNVNEAYGYDYADQLLKVAASRVIRITADVDVAGRQSGDTFAVILTDLADVNEANDVARQFMDALSEPFQMEGKTVYITPCIGITIYPDDARDRETLIRNADQALESASEKARNRISYFKPSTEEVASKRIALIAELRKAIEEQQFEVMFQPIVELATGKIHKAESLIRWQHPRQGLISPAEFIPLAEETGLIFEISVQAFDKVVRQVAHWRQQYYPDFQVSFNMSPVEFHDEDDNFGGLFDVLKTHAVSGRSVVVEITEGILLISNEMVQQKLRHLHEEGIEVALDDFGTGYSALSYLKRFNIDYLKIDQSFVRDLESEPRDRSLIEAMIVMGQSMGMKVIAEGVSTAGQAAILRAAGCEYGQGYAFSVPLNAVAFEKLLKKNLFLDSQAGPEQV